MEYVLWHEIFGFYLLILTIISLIFFSYWLSWYWFFLFSIIYFSVGLCSANLSLPDIRVGQIEVICLSIDQLFWCIFSFDLWLIRRLSLSWRYYLKFYDNNEKPVLVIERVSRNKNSQFWSLSQEILIEPNRHASYSLFLFENFPPKLELT